MIFKQIFRIAFVALVWKQYKGLIISSVKNAQNDEDDPFSAIRDMEKLRSRADFIEQQKKNS